MSDIKELSQEQIDEISKPIAPSFLSTRHDGLTSIKPIAISMRFNKVFGYGKWQLTVLESNTKPDKKEGWYSAIVKVRLEVPQYGIVYECVAGNTNKDEGDSAKGAISDCMGKIASWLGIGWQIYAGK